MPSPITTHVLDVSRGCPASGVDIVLTLPDGTSVNGCTNVDGRLANLLMEDHALVPGIYTIRFDAEKYFSSVDDIFFPHPEITFKIPNPPAPHYQVPLLVTPYSFTTYRGS